MTLDRPMVDSGGLAGRGGVVLAGSRTAPRVRIHPGANRARRLVFPGRPTGAAAWAVHDALAHRSSSTAAGRTRLTAKATPTAKRTTAAAFQAMSYGNASTSYRIWCSRRTL